MLNLGVNVDHVATVRQARKAAYPQPLEAALIAEKAGAWGITAHLREDRRHINDADLSSIAANVRHLNMEMAVTQEMLDIALKLKPHSCCLVPEKRQELTTEGGLDVLGNFEWINAGVKQLMDEGIIVSIFIDPELAQLEAAAKTGAEYVELHTGSYANASDKEQEFELNRLIRGAEFAKQLGLMVNAGHGIDYDNIAGILKIPYLHELNIGHSIIARAVMVGMEQAVKEMLDLMVEYPG
ncbi:MAG: pyridoxine 5'-phosphate synthase [Victivallales bacterium]|nr:pyridoxine 5'-phosphate synthase [Victivallales bacterium]